MSKVTKIRKVRKISQRMPLVFYLTVFIFVISSVTATLLFTLYIWLIKAGLSKEWDIISIGVALLIGSIVISTFLVRGFGNQIMFRSLIQINDATKAVANGDFSQRLKIPKEKETAEICENFNEMVNKLSNNELLARDFVSNVSHQFRNPLSSIHGYVQLLENDDLTEKERAEYIEIIKDKAMSLSELVNDILELSKIEHQSAALVKDKFFLDEQLRKCVLNLETEISAKNLEVFLDFDTVEYYGNSELLKEVWINLLENAIKFSENGSNIYITLKSDSENATVTIEDEGIGMTVETKERLFDRFYRGKEAYAYSGSGLGMPMVKNVVDKHDGIIKIDSELGKGSTFTISLPM